MAHRPGRQDAGEPVEDVVIPELLGEAFDVSCGAFGAGEFAGTAWGRPAGLVTSALAGSCPEGGSARVSVPSVGTCPAVAATRWAASGIDDHERSLVPRVHQPRRPGFPAHLTTSITPLAYPTQHLFAWRAHARRRAQAMCCPIAPMKPRGGIGIEDGWVSDGAVRPGRRDARHR